MIRILVSLCFCVLKVFGQGGIQFQPGMTGTQTGFQGPGFSPIGTQTFQPQPGMPQNPTQTGTTSTGFGSPFTGPMVTGGMPFGPGSVFGPMGPLRPLSRKYCPFFSSFTILFRYKQKIMYSFSLKFWIKIEKKKQNKTITTLNPTFLPTIHWDEDRAGHKVLSWVWSGGCLNDISLNCWEKRRCMFNQQQKVKWFHRVFNAVNQYRNLNYVSMMLHVCWYRVKVSKAWYTRRCSKFISYFQWITEI